MNTLLDILIHLWGQPEWLWVLVAVPGLFVSFYFIQRHRRHVLSRLGNLSLLTGLADRLSNGLRWLRVALLSSALGFAALAAARPQWGTTNELVKAQGIDIVILLDTSLSMLAQDVAPNRLSAAKHEISSFLDHLTSDQIALVPFAGSAFIQCPLTLDYSAVKLFLNDINTNTIPDQGTAIGTAIRVGMKAFPRNSEGHRAMILITDGEDHQSHPIKAAEDAAKEDIPIYTIGIGSTEGDLIPQQGTGGRTEFLRDSEGHVVKSRLDEVTLQRIAVETGGKYYHSTAGEMELNQIFKDINRLEHGTLSEEQRMSRVDRYQWPLAAAVLLLLIVPFVPERRRSQGPR